MKTILLIDDQTGVMEVTMDLILLDTDSRVLVADNTDNAKLIMQGVHIDILICDLHLRGEMGDSFSKVAKSINPVVKFIIMTSDHNYEINEDVDDIIYKPSIYEELIKHVS